MKKSLSHLPDGKRRELEFTVGVLKDALTDVLATRRSPELLSGTILKIILFGSYARGGWVDDPVGRYFSDFDLLVVVNNERLTDTGEFWREAENKLLSALVSGQHLRTPVSFIVHSLDDVNHQLERGRYFWVDIMREGIELFGAPGVEFSPVQPMPVEVALSEAQAYYDEAMHFVERHQKVFSTQAEEGLQDARWRKDAAFTAHQMAERLYLTLLMVMTHYVPKSHNLIFLRKRTDEFDERLREVWPVSNKFERRCFELLRAAYVKARYSPHYKVSSDELEWIAEQIGVLRGVVASICEARLTAMKAASGH